MNLEESPQSLVTVKDILLTNADNIRNLLPRYIDEQKFIAASLTLLRKQPTLMECTPASFFGALVESAQLGLMPGTQGLSYFIPFRNNKTHCREVQLIPGYKGLVQLAYNSDKVDKVEAHMVYENDEFHYQLGLRLECTHIPAQGSRGGMTACYAIVKLASGEHLLEVMSLEEVEAHRNRYSKAAREGPWVTDFQPMALKTVLRKVLKLAPQSAELMRGIVLDEQAGSGQSQVLDVYDWKGLEQLSDWQEKSQEFEEGEAGASAEDNPAAILAPKYGAFAQKPLGEIPTKVLASYRNVAQKNLKDRSKSRWHPEHLELIKGIDLLIAARADVEAHYTQRGIPLDPKDLLGTWEQLQAKLTDLQAEEKPE